LAPVGPPPPEGPILLVGTKTTSSGLLFNPQTICMVSITSPDLPVRPTMTLPTGQLTGPKFDPPSPPRKLSARVDCITNSALTNTPATSASANVDLLNMMCLLRAQTNLDIAIPEHAMPNIRAARPHRAIYGRAKNACCPFALRIV